MFNSTNYYNILRCIFRNEHVNSIKKNISAIFFRAKLSFTDSRGFIAIIVACFIPLIMLSIKYSDKLFSIINKTLTTKSGGNLYKRCAREAALAVAKNWNPGLTIDQQKDAILKIADSVYNAHPCYSDASQASRTIPGLIEEDSSGNKKGLSPSRKQISYSTNNYYKYTTVSSTVSTATENLNTSNYSWTGTINNDYFRWIAVDVSTEPQDHTTTNCFDEAVGEGNNFNLNHKDIYKANNQFITKINSSSGSAGSYTTRKTPSGVDYVQVSVDKDKDKIKVITDEQIAYGVPAKCNVDIVLAVPVHDSSPVSEIGSSCRNFIKNNFYHTRGVYMSLIPYSAKLSIPPSRISYWTTSIPAFDDSNTNFQVMIGACLYATKGKKDQKLNQTNYDWATASTACPIMCRRLWLERSNSRYGNNRCAEGYFDIFIPSSIPNSDLLGYRKMNLNPCYGGYANMLSMKCEKDCTTFLPNPYYVIEPTADLSKIYEMCGALSSISDDKNTSNFIFLPLEWSANMFSSWTANPGVSASDKQLSLESKTTANRKKAIVLIVNKPDTFAPGELTYLGFNNDYSEFPTVESDKIDFSIDYSDKTKKFANGDSYDGTIQGAKKILKFTTTSGTVERKNGYYECNDTSTGRLTFPKKGLVKVVVEPTISSSIQWSKKNCNLYSLEHGEKDSDYCWTSMGRVGIGTIKGKDNQLVIQSNTGRLAYSSDGETFEEVGYGGDPWIWLLGLVSNGSGYFFAINKDNNDIRWIQSSGGYLTATNSEPDLKSERSFAYGNGIYMLATEGGNICTGTNGINYTVVYKSSEKGVNVSGRLLGYGGGRWIAGKEGTTYESTDQGVSWTLLDSSLENIRYCGDEWYGTCYVNGYFYAISYAAPSIIARSKNGKDWKNIEASTFSDCNRRHRNITFYNGKFYVFSEQGDCVHIGDFVSLLKFTNITAETESTTTADEYKITEKQEFYITASQISDSKDSGGNYYIDFETAGVRLISAEISNRPYAIVTPACSLSGTTSGTGTAYITTNVRQNMQITATVAKIFANATFTKGDNCSMENKVFSNFTSEQSFTVPEDKFSHGGNTTNSTEVTVVGTNGRNKIKYSLTNATITKAELANQKCWCWVQHGSGSACFGCYDLSKASEEDAVYYVRNRTKIPSSANSSFSLSDGEVLFDAGKVSLNLIFTDRHSFYTDSDGPMIKFRSAQAKTEIGNKSNKRVIISLGYHHGTLDVKYLPDNIEADIPGTLEVYAYNGDDSADAYLRRGNYNDWNTINSFSKCDKTDMDDKGRYYRSSGTSNTKLCVTIEEYNTPDGSNYFSYMHWKAGKTRSLTDGGVKLEDNYIKFSGTGDLTVTVKPTTASAKHGTVTDSTRGTKTAIVSSFSEDVSQIININPDEYNYAEQSDGTYKITLNIENLKSLSNLKLLDTDRIYKFHKPTLPERSRYIDFSTNFSMNSEGDNTYNYTNSDSSIKWRARYENYDNNLGYWVSSNGNYPFFEVYNYSTANQNIIGDFFFLIDDIGTTAPQMRFFNRSRGPETYMNVKNELYFMPGLHRRYQDFNDIRTSDMASFDFVNGNSSGAKLQYIVAGFTRPVNSVLWLNGYQSDTKNQNDPTGAVKELTADACSTLRVSGVRIDVVVYRAQTGDYAYLNNCAVNGGKTYTVSSQSDLTNTLNTIAAEIKDWAGYTKASSGLK